MGTNLALKLLSAADILDNDDVVFEDVPTPEWAPKAATAEEKAAFAVRICALTAEGRAEFIKRNIDAKNSGLVYDVQMETVLVAMTAVDAEGKPLFSMPDVERLKRKNAAAVARCAAVAQRLSKLDEGTVKETEKPSAPAPS